MKITQKKEWDPFKIVSETEYYSNLEKIHEFNKSVFSGLARYKDSERNGLNHKAA